MLGHRPLILQDYLGILKRRIWLIVIPTIIFPVIAVAISYRLSPEFVSQTLVLVEQQKVPDNYVKPVVTEDLNGRLATMKEQILSRSRLEPIIEHFNLFAGKNTNMDDRIDATRRAIAIKPIQSELARTGGLPGFFISFKAQDARVAQQVCGEITSLFLSENLHAREASAEGTTDFLKEQLADAKRNLDDQDGKLAAFERKYLGKLPGQEASNSNTLSALSTQLDAATQSLNRMQQDETYVEAMLAAQTREIQNREPTTGLSVDARQQQLQQMIAEKAELEARYTPDYPDVVTLSRKIAELQQQLAQPSTHPNPTTAGTGTSARPEPPQILQLRAQLHAMQQGIINKKQDQARLEQQIRMYEGRIESSPMVEQEYKQVTRDYQTALQFYNELLAKMNQSSMATDLERRQQGEQFRVMDAPNLPEEPTFPNRRVFATMGIAAGLALGLLLSALLEYRDTAMRNERDVWAFTKLPTLAVISHLDSAPQLGMRGAKRSRLFPKFTRHTKVLEGSRG